MRLVKVIAEWCQRWYNLSVHNEVENSSQPIRDLVLIKICCNIILLSVTWTIAEISFYFCYMMRIPILMCFKIPCNYYCTVLYLLDVKTREILGKENLVKHMKTWKPGKSYNGKISIVSNIRQFKINKGAV